MEARDFCRWLQLAAKPAPAALAVPGRRRRVRRRRGQAGASNPVTGKPSPAVTYAAATVAHCESVLRGFYDFHLEAGTGPMVNPFPLSRSRRGGRAHAHHNPMEPFRSSAAAGTGRRWCSGCRGASRTRGSTSCSPQLGSHRDRALVAFWVSTGARASELLGATVADADPGQQLITVIRKGTRALQQLPASPDAFVWLRLYQAQMAGPGAGRAGRAVVVDAAAPVPGVDL